MSKKQFIPSNKGSFICPFCNFCIPVNSDNYSKYEVSSSYVKEFQPEIVSGGNAGYSSYKPPSSPDEELFIEFRTCTHYECQKTNISIEGSGTDTAGLNMRLHPLGSSRDFPDYIPKSIIQDYREACAIVDLSPKASATLSRRSLQSVIRDFWNVKNKKNLFSEIEAIKSHVAPSVWQAMDSLRKLGNIGAHSEKDINLIIDVSPEEARILIQFVEYIFEISYIEKRRTDHLLKTVQDINRNKEIEKISRG